MAKSKTKSVVFRPGGFLYDDVKRELCRRIDAGVYAPGSRIPTVKELTREFQVSAITIRRALRDLTVAGRLRGHQGLGVFVAHAPRIVRSLGVDFRTSIGDEIQRAGAEPGVKQLSLALVPAEPRVATLLGLAESTLVYRLEKLILADSEPAAFDTTYLPQALGDALKDDLHRDFVFPLLVARGLAPDHIDFRIEAGAVSDVQAPAFGLPVGFPVLVVDYTPIRPDGTAILTGRSVSRADRFAYSFCPSPRVHRDAQPAKPCRTNVDPRGVADHRAEPEARPLVPD